MKGYALLWNHLGGVPMEQPRDDGFDFYCSYQPEKRRSKAAQKRRKMLLIICGVLAAI